jgi:PAS domain S-box-containing protein
LLGDVTGNPALLLRVTMNRDIIAQGQSTFRFFAVALLVIALVGGLLTSGLLDRTVLSRIARLRNDVDQISTTGDLNYRVKTEGQDELSALGNKLNEMLQALDAAQKAQRESDERLRTLVNNAPLVVWSIDSSGMLRLVDGNELKELGIEPAQLIGKPAADWVDKIPLDEPDLKKALAGETVTTTNQVGELSFQAHYLPLKDEKGRVTSVIGVATNITERLAAEAGMKDANQSLDHTNRQLRRAHELLGSTVEQMTDLIQRGSSTEELKDSLEFIQQELKKLQN